MPPCRSSSFAPGALKTNDEALARALRRVRPPVHVALTDGERIRLGVALRLGIHVERIPTFPPSWVDINVHSVPNAPHVLARVAAWADRRGHLLTARARWTAARR